MPSTPEVSGSVATTPEEAPSPDSVARDTERTAASPASTLPGPAIEEPSTEAASEGATLATPERATPTSDVRSHPSDTENHTLHSASHPGSGSAAQWDERRILHLEHEFDQLSARHRLQDKRIDDLALRLRSLVAVALLMALALAVWLVAQR